MRILIVADEEACGATCGGFSIDEAARLDDATGHIENVPYDAVVLDLGLPDGDGLTLIRIIRRSRGGLQVLVLPRDSLQDHVRGLDTGADDYLVNPFAMEKLVARIRALLRRPGQVLGAVLTAGVPPIAGQREDYLLKALRGYKDNSRPAISKGKVPQLVADGEIRDLAYFAPRLP